MINASCFYSKFVLIVLSCAQDHSSSACLLTCLPPLPANLPDIHHRSSNPQPPPASKPLHSTIIPANPAINLLNLKLPAVSCAWVHLVTLQQQTCCFWLLKGFRTTIKHNTDIITSWSHGETVRPIFTLLLGMI